MNLLDLNSKILELMPFQKMKELVKNLSERLESKNQEVQQLEDENKELKSKMRELIGEQKLPDFKAGKKRDSKTRDPNKEYKEPKKKGSGRGKRGKRNEKIKISRREKLKIDKSTLPSDAISKGFRKIIIQEITFETNNVEFKIPRFYSPSLNKYFEAELPTGYKGHEFGPKLRAFILMMNTQCRVTENKIKSIFDTLGIFISVGHINKITQTIPPSILSEMLNAKDTAIEKEENMHVDASGIKINGVSNYLQCICNKYFSWFDLLKDRSRYEVVKGLIGTNKNLIYIIDEWAIEWLQGRRKEDVFIRKFKEHLGKKFLSEKEFEKFLDNLKIKNVKDKNYLRTAALLSAYDKGLLGSRVKGLVSDDAGEYKDIVLGHQLCWIHELRHYRLIKIATGFMKETLDIFFDKAWSLYRFMSEYKNDPSLKNRIYIEKEFKELFETKWNNYHIDSLQKNTIKRKEGLLRFLDSPSLEIHNNSCEFDIREKVVKKKISYGHKSTQGCHNGNFWLSLFHTARKNRVTFWDYLVDRFSGQNLIPKLSEIIQLSA
jgi:hypothetical protein